MKYIDLNFQHSFVKHLKIIGADKTKRYPFTEVKSVKRLYERVDQDFGVGYKLYMCTNSVWMITLDRCDEMELDSKLTYIGQIV